MTLHETFAENLRAAGLQILACEPVSGQRRSPNPTRIAVRRGRANVHYDVFLWKITHEGRGRSGDNWRIQATSFGKKNSPVEVTRNTIGLGWHEGSGVYVAFDPWVKRSPGTSSSVHIHDDLLRQAAEDGLVKTTHRDSTWDPRLAFTPEHAVEVFGWMQHLWRAKDVDLAVVAYSNPTPDRVVAEADPSPNASPNAAGVRTGDRVALYDERYVRLTDYYWRVMSIDVKDVTPESGRNRIHYVLEADKSAKLPKDQ